jgi:c-di-GMP-binding flagellar brake protein YcgR
MKERRTYPRFECPKDKSCPVINKKVSGFYGELKNISRAGAAFVSESRLDDNSKVDIFIKYPDLGRDISAELQIVWSHFKNGLYTYGGRFLSISNEDKYDLLDHFYENWKRDILAKRY